MGSFQLLLNLASVVLLSYQFKANSATSSFLSTTTVTTTATTTATATTIDTPTKGGGLSWSVMFASLNITGNTLLAANQLMIGKDNTVGEFSLANNHYVNVPTFATSSIMFAPLLVVGLVPELSDSYVVAQWLVVVAVLVAGAIVDDNLSSLFEVAHYAILSSLLLYLMRKRCLDAKRQIASLLQEMNDLKEQLQSGENRMKHMVANMAHDLKTPLSSFMAGIDLIQQEMGKYENHLMHRELNKDDVGALFFTIKECLRTIMNTNSFMLMTINRVLDYAKASKGLKLVPKYETIDLMDTLYLPMNCMKDIQQRVSIVLEPLSLEICSHIITDKQWLQENVLCLLSNAVKYSSGGTVTVRVSLEQASASDGDSNQKSPTRQYRSPTSVAWSPKGKSGVRRSTTVLPDLIDQSNALIRSPSDEHGTCDNQVHLLHVEVEDTGIGMSDQAMSELFSPFKQNQRLAGGTGLGLFSLAQRVEALHGQCGVMHRRDGQQGSLFWFTMPYRPDLAAKKREAVARELDSTARYNSVEGKVDFPTAPLLVLPPSLFDCAHEQPTLGISTSSLNTLGPTTMNENIRNQPSNRLRILLVDDSPMILRLTSVMLSKQGYEVTAAENGAIALELIRNRLATLQDGPRILQCNGWQELEPAFDVILTDLQMPVMDGLELVKRLREMEADINQQFAARNGHGQVLQEIVMSPFASSRHRKRMGSSVKESPALMVEDMSPPPEMRHIVIGLSANSDDETLEQSIQVGIDGFLSKPFAMGAFHQLLDNLR